MLCREADRAINYIDALEQKKIFSRMDEFELDNDDKVFFMDELRVPFDVDYVAGAARTPEEAAAIYAASLLDIDIDTAQEKSYLNSHAVRLKLDATLVEHIHATVEAATETITPV